MESWTSLQTRYLGGAKPAAFTKLIELAQRLIRRPPATSHNWGFSHETHEQYDFDHRRWQRHRVRTHQTTHALGNTILITGRDQAKMDARKRPFQKFTPFRSDVSRSESDRHSLREGHRTIPELNILINNAGIMREINVHDKAGSLEDITREIEINLSGPIRMVKQFLPHLKNKSEAAIINVSSGLAFVPFAHFTGLLRHQGRSAFVHRVSSCATEKHQSEGI